MIDRKVFMFTSAFCLLALGYLGISAAASYLMRPSENATSDSSVLTPRSGPDRDMIARLDDYARSVGTKESASPPPSGELLPDVNTMTQRLAARLKTTPADIKGWRMLGWSYFHTAHYKEAAAAYARAVELDPSSDELKRSYEEAKAKASASDNSKSVSTGPPRMHDNGGDPSSVGKTARSEATPASEQDVAIRAMVDGLANRLENAPRDVEGWTRLMRSRVVLGEREVATSALRKALKVFKDDTTASEKIMAAAVELDLKAE